jgi:hypothetical protein
VGFEGFVVEGLAGPGVTSHRRRDVVEYLERDEEFERAEQAMRAVRHPRQAQISASFAHGLELGDEHADAGTIDVGDGPEVHDQLRPLPLDEVVNALPDTKSPSSTRISPVRVITVTSPSSVS